MPKALRALIWASESSSSTFLVAPPEDPPRPASAPATFSGTATLLGAGSSAAGVMVNEALEEAAGRLEAPGEPVWEREMPGGSRACTFLGI